MKTSAVFLLVLCHLAVSHGHGPGMRIVPVPRPGPRPRTWTCGEAPNLYNAQQIEAGQGKVVARDRNSYAYFLVGASWYRLGFARFRDVTVGPAGLWGAGTNSRIYKYVAGNFLLSSGLSMMQVDAGGDDQLVGVSTSSRAYCLRGSTALTHRGGGSLSWSYLSRSFRHISCSPNNGCWAIDRNYRVYHSRSMSSNCVTAAWTLVTGPRMRMIDVGTDGTVIGLTTTGQVYERISTNLRSIGYGWSLVTMCMGIRDLSYDLGQLWVVTNSGIILKCRG